MILALGVSSGGGNKEGIEEEPSGLEGNGGNGKPNGDEEEGVWNGIPPGKGKGKGKGREGSEEGSGRVGVLFEGSGKVGELEGSGKVGVVFEGSGNVGEFEGSGNVGVGGCSGKTGARRRRWLRAAETVALPLNEEDKAMRIQRKVDNLVEVILEVFLVDSCF
ncbi:hypothetical protein LIER_33709 [Lithospermum erythrorhizon]|uniref:Uncharacterized protein n=1 Tax=Lithospermum erythrorhizon TaxID=34254 RepID=A0AAV3S2G6_LITER